MKLATRDRILDISERLFAEKGFEATTLRDIAREVGIQNPSLYKHFESKAEIYENVLDRAVRPILDDYWDTEDEIRQVVALFAARPTVCRLLLREMLGNGSELQPLVVDRFVEMVDRTRAFLVERHGEAPSRVDLVLRVLAISYMLFGMRASSQFFHELTGRDLSGDAASKSQVAIVAAVSEALFARTESPR